MDGPKEDALPKVSAKRLSVLKFIAADNAEEESSEDEEYEPPTENLLGLDVAPNEAIDWDEPLTVNAEELQEPGGEPPERIQASKLHAQGSAFCCVKSEELGAVMYATDNSNGTELECGLGI